MRATRYEVLAGDTTTVIVSATDPDDDLLSYTWSKTGGAFISPDENDRRVWQAPSESGSYEVSVLVRDENGGEASDKVTITVPSQEPPVVEILSPTQGESIPGIGTCEIRVRAMHGTSPIERVEFLVDGSLQYTDTSPVSSVYSYDWALEGVSGPKNIAARGYVADYPDLPGADSVMVVIEGVTRFPLR
jgi:hypothetical protein